MTFLREEPPPSMLETSYFVGKNARCVPLEHNLAASHKVTPHQHTTAQNNPLSLFTHAFRELPSPGKIQENPVYCLSAQILDTQTQERASIQ